MVDTGFMKLATPFDRDGRESIAIFEGGDRCLEIPPVCHAVCADWSAGRQFKFLTIIFANKAACRAVYHLDAVD